MMTALTEFHPDEMLSAPSGGLTREAALGVLRRALPSNTRQSVFLANVLGTIGALEPTVGAAVRDVLRREGLEVLEREIGIGEAGWAPVLAEALELSLV